VLSPGYRNKYLENAKDLTSEVKLWQTLKLTYFIAEKHRRKVIATPTCMFIQAYSLQLHYKNN